MLTCGICGKECKTRQGLIAHRRLKHLVVNGETTGGDQSGQRSASSGDQSERSGEWSGEGGKAAAAVVAVVAGDQSSEAFGEQSGESWAEWKILSIVREHHETGVWAPGFLELVKDVVNPEHGELSVRSREALRGFGKWDRLNQGAS